MARHKTKTIDPADVDDNGLAASQSLSGAGNLTLNGALISGGTFSEAENIGRKIAITSAGADSGINWTITGTDAEGRALTDTFSGVDSAAATSNFYFGGVTIISGSGATAGNVIAGTVDEVATNTIPLDKYNSDPATVSIEQITGTINITVQETFTDIQSDSTPQWYAVSALTSKTAATRSDINAHATAVRFIVNSYTNGADFTGIVVQNRP